MLDLEARFIMWWRINVSGRLHLREFLRYMLAQKGKALTAARTVEESVR